MDENLSSFRLKKKNRLCSKKALEKLFSAGNHSVTSWPVRAVFIPNEEHTIRIMVSVSKRFFKRAVHRNHIKRQLREAYRLNQHLLATTVKDGLDIAFLWNSGEILPSNVVEKKIQNLLRRIQETQYHA